jgi:predicted Ser/Thr protein kinase
MPASASSRKSRRRRGNVGKKTRRQRGGKLCEGSLRIPNNESNNSKNIYSLNSINNDSKGKGTFEIYKDKDNANLLIKVIGPLLWKSRKDIENEFEIAEVASNLNIGPKIHYKRICKNSTGTPVGYLVMEKITGHNLSAPETTKEQIDAANALLKQFNDAGYLHNDPHYNNAMWGSTPSHPEERAWIIDFDLATKQASVASAGAAAAMPSIKYETFHPVD